MQLSIHDQFHYKTVLLTGGLGGVGSVCLEQLLRQTQVKSVILLVRRRGSSTAHERVRKLLCSPLFHVLHQQAAAGGFNPFAKVRVIEGDLDHPGLVLSESDRQFVLAEVDIVLHCAADLALESHIQRTLRANYCGTRRLLDFAREVPNLRAFVFVSTFYVNNFRPFNSAVKEEVHQLPLQLAGDHKPLSHGQLVELLLSMPPHTAAAEAAALMDSLNFASTYAFGKHLTEQLFNEADSLPGVGKAIVRPSLVCSVAGTPYPGFCSGLTGAPGFMLGYGTGYIHSIKGVAHASDAIADLIPADAVSALIVSAAAAAAANGPGDGTAKVYHATSADSHPCSIRQVYQAAATFWAANPCPSKVPFARYPTYDGHHNPTLTSVQKHQRVTGLKVALAAKLLQLSGKSKHAAALAHGFKTTKVMNTPRMCRSFVSLVDNARELQASLAPGEADMWRSVWEKDSCMSWDTYLFTTFAGLYTKAFRAPKSGRSLVTPVLHLFIQQEGLADVAVMEQWMAGSYIMAVPAQPKWATAGKGIQLVAQSGHGTAFGQRAADQETSLSHTSSVSDAMVLVS